MYKPLYLLLLVCVTIQLTVAAGSLELTKLVSRSAAQSAPYDVVPIIECIDVNNKAYFTYKNNAEREVTLGLSDRNRLTPLGIAPISTFVNGSGPSFPNSTQISLAGYENSTFYWDLEEYRLAFNINPALSCPNQFNLSFVITYSRYGPALSPDLITEIFANLTGISTSRLNITSSDVYIPPAPTKRSVFQSFDDAVLSLDIELTDGNSTDSSDRTAAEVVNDFVTNQKQAQLNQTLSENFPSANVKEFNTNSDPTPSIEGQIRPPVSAPVSPPNHLIIKPIVAPIVSSAALISINLFVLLCTVLANLRRSAAAAPQNTIIPILECIDKHNKAYFSYENGFGDVVGLGKSVQNILSPLDIAPITYFVNGSGPAFPLSAQVSLAGFENSTFNWNLINYFLTFNITPELACPTVFNITLKFNYEVEGSLGFFPPEHIVTKFAQVAGISESRVTLLDWNDTGPTAKRVLDTADLTVEIQLADGNSTNSNATDPTAAEIINQFVNGTKTQELTQQLQTEFSPKYSNLTEFTPKSDPTPSIYGQVRPPTSVPSTDPVAPMAENVPNASPTSPVSSPKPKTTLSSATLFSFNITLLLVTVMIALVKISQM